MKETGNKIDAQKDCLLSFWTENELSGSLKFERILGYGGRSTVVEARNRFGEIVAVKLPLTRQKNVPDNILKKILTHEGRVLSSISHPGVVRIIEADKTGRYLVLEKLSEQSLSLKYRNVLPTGRSAVSYTISLSETLEAIHQEGFLHLDLKPKNILFRDSDSEYPVVTDFGSARPVSKPIGAGTIDSNKLGSGKYLFKAPEQLINLGDRFGPQTDFFALGIILYWLLCGTFPFSNKSVSVAEALDLYRCEYKKAINHLELKQFPSTIVELLGKLLKINTGERKVTAVEIKSILHCFLETELSE